MARLMPADQNLLKDPSERGKQSLHRLRSDFVTIGFRKKLGNHMRILAASCLKDTKSKKPRLRWSGSVMANNA